MRKTDHQQPAPDESLKMAHQVINSSWQILKRHHDNTQWDTLIKDLDSLINEYQGQPALETLAYNIALGVYDFLGFLCSRPRGTPPRIRNKGKIKYGFYRQGEPCFYCAKIIKPAPLYLEFNKLKF